MISIRIVPSVLDPQHATIKYLLGIYVFVMEERNHVSMKDVRGMHALAIIVLVMVLLHLRRCALKKDVLKLLMHVKNVFVMVVDDDVVLKHVKPMHGMEDIVSVIVVFKQQGFH